MRQDEADGYIMYVILFQEALLPIIEVLRQIKSF